MASKKILVIVVLLSVILGVGARSPRKTEKLYRKAGKWQRKLRDVWALLGVKPFLVQPGEEGDECVLKSKVEEDYVLKSTVEADACGTGTVLDAATMKCTVSDDYMLKSEVTAADAIATGDTQQQQPVDACASLSLTPEENDLAHRGASTRPGYTICGDASQISGHANNIKGDVSNLQGEVSYIAGDVSNLKGFVTNLKGDVSNLYGWVAQCDSGEGCQCVTDDSKPWTRLTSNRCEHGDLDESRRGARISGDVSRIYGDISEHLRGDVSHLCGDVTGLTGYAGLYVSRTRIADGRRLGEEPLYDEGDAAAPVDEGPAGATVCRAPSGAVGCVWDSELCAGDVVECGDSDSYMWHWRMSTRPWTCPSEAEISGCEILMEPSYELYAYDD